MKKRIAFFDFDGTITTKDSLLAFILFRHGKWKTLLGLITISPYYAAYMLKLIPVQKAKEQVLKRFFRNEPIDKLESACKEFVSTVVPSLVRPKALKEIRLLKELGTEVVIISASPSNWLRILAKEMRTELICTELEVKDGKLTGRIVGNNCRGVEKVRRITARYNLSDYDEVYAYGDTKGDKPMLGLATFQFYKPFS